MRRFNNNDIKKLKNGKNVYRSKIYPNSVFSDADIYISTEDGDRLDTLAYNYYGNPNLWWVIAVANNIHDAPLSLEPGLILRLPADFTTVTNKMQ